MTDYSVRPMRVVAVSGGLQRSSKSTLLAQHLLSGIGKALPCQTQLVTIGELAAQFAGASLRTQLPQTVEQALAVVEKADMLVVATPVFRGAYTGMFKHFFDHIHQDALIDKPILLAATGGSQRHALMIDHQLRPLFSFFQARTLPLGVYATDSDFEHGQLCNSDLLKRAQLAVERALPVIELTARQPAAEPLELAVA